MPHKAIIAAISAVKEIPGADRIQIAFVLGEQVIVSKELGVGSIGVLFPAGLQLSEEYCKENNLFRHAHLNKDPNQKGFFEDNRRVRTQPFLGVKSDAYFSTLESLAYTGFNQGDVVIGLSFDEWGNHKICQKYYSESTKAAKVSGAGVKQAKKNYAPFFEKHVDSSHFKHEAGQIKKGSILFFHQKKHGTSFRVARTRVLRELSHWKQNINWIFHAEIFKEKMEYDYVVGTRNVVLQNNEKIGFHGSEQFRFDVFEQLKPHLEDGVQIFGEIVGYVNGKPIMPTHAIEKLKDKNFTKKYGKEVTYTYGCKEHEFKWHIYRVAFMLPDGSLLDLSQKQLEKWCEQRGLPSTFEVHDPIVYDGDEEKLRSLVEALTERPEVLTEDFTDPSHISEGIILRVEDGGITPKFMKSKSFAFRCMESLCEAMDTEDAV